MLGNEDHGHIPHTSTAAFFCYPKLPAINFSRFFGAVHVLTREKSQTSIDCFSIYSYICIYKDSQTSPSSLWLGLEEKGLNNGFIWFVLCLWLSFPASDFFSLFFCLFYSSFNFASCFVLFIPL